MVLMVALAQPADQWAYHGLPACAPIGWVCALVVGCTTALNRQTTGVDRG